MNTVMPYVVGIGAANVDISGKSLDRIVPRDSNPGHITISAGGVTRNILDNLSRLGVAVKLISAVGTDLFSSVLRKECAAAGIDLSHLLVAEGEATSTYLDILDEGGDMSVAVSDMRILKKLTPAFLRAKKALIENASAVVVDGCLPRELIVPLTESIQVPIFADTVSTEYARTIRAVMGRCYMLKPNLAELEVLSGRPVSSDAEIEAACEAVLNSGARHIVVTLGPRGCYYADWKGRRCFRSLRKLEVVENATGAGDAFTAGLLYGYLHGLAIPETLDFALGAGIVAISSLRTINPLMSQKMVRETVIRCREPPLKKTAVTG